MAEVAYLLGAGASAECIPVVKDMAAKIENFREILISHLRDKPNSFSNAISLRYMPDLINQRLEKLIDICRDYYSIDTYAKKLYLTDSELFNELKLDLCYYFTAVQIILKIDKRYDNFFSSIITKKDQLPNKIKLISWNYDFQLELSYAEFCQATSLNDSRDFLQTCSPFEYAKLAEYSNKFSVLKLNGSARIKDGNSHDFLVNVLSKDVTTDVQALTDRYLNLLSSGKYSTELKFAWENENYEALFRAYKRELANIEVLVVIGYSFPFFNREVDMALFSEMTQLNKVYIQDKNPENILETMEEFLSFGRIGENGRVKKTQVILKRNLDQFVFPKELDITGAEGHPISSI